MMYSKKVIIIYEKEDINLEKALKELDVQLDKKYIYECNDLDFSYYDLIIVSNIYNKIENTELLSKIEQTNKPLFWIGNRIEDYINYSDKYYIQYIGMTNNMDKVIYEDKDIFINEYDYLNKIKTLDNSKVKTISTMQNSYEKYPYILKSNNLTYMAGSDILDKDITKDMLVKLCGLRYKTTSVEDATVKTELKTEKEMHFEKNLKTINDVIVSFILIILIIFTIIFIAFRYLNRRKFRK